MRPYSPKNAESMNANPRIGPAVPAKKNRIPSDRYSEMMPGFVAVVVVAEEEEAGESPDVDGDASRLDPSVDRAGKGGNGKAGEGNGEKEDLPTRGDPAAVGFGAEFEAEDDDAEWCEW